MVIVFKNQLSVHELGHHLVLCSIVDYLEHLTKGSPSSPSSAGPLRDEILIYAAHDSRPRAGDGSCVSLGGSGAPFW